MYVSPQGLLVAGNDPQLNPNDKGLIAAVLPQRGAVRVIAKGIHQPWAFANGQDIQITAGAGMQTAGVGANGLSNQTVRLHSTANATNTVWERPVKQVSVLVVFVKYGNASGATPLFENGSPNTAPYEAWSVVDAAGALQFGYSAGGTFRFLAGAAGSIVNGRLNVALATYDGATARLFLNGALLNTGSQTGDLTYPNASDRGPGFCSFFDYAFNNRALNGRIFLGGLWETGLSLGRGIEITRSPQAAFEAVLGQPRLWLPMPVSAGGGSLDFTQTTGVALAGTVSTSGNIQIGTNFNLTQSSAVGLTGSLAATGDIQIGTTFNLAQTANVGLAGSLGVSGDIQILSGSLDLTQTSAVAMSGTVGLSGDIQIGTSFNLAQTAAVGLTGSVGTTGDIQIGTSFDLAQSVVLAMSGSVTVAGDFQSDTAPIVTQSFGNFGWDPRKRLSWKRRELREELEAALDDAPKAVQELVRVSGLYISDTPVREALEVVRKARKSKEQLVLRREIDELHEAVETVATFVKEREAARQARRRKQQHLLLLS